MFYYLKSKTIYKVENNANFTTDMKRYRNYKFALTHS